MGGGAVISVKSGEGYLFHQDQPARLCCDRELSTSEIHESNDFYGQASVLKRYVGYPTSYALKAVLEHAPVVQDSTHVTVLGLACMVVASHCGHFL